VSLTFAGSGTAGLAARHLGCAFVGFEIEPGPGRRG
jgi:hypothetical protein